MKKRGEFEGVEQFFEEVSVNRVKSFMEVDLEEASGGYGLPIIASYYVLRYQDIVQKLSTWHKGCLARINQVGEDFF